jgi:ubiquinone/menaquinone biosynthesis C-methylase UbiE
MTEPIYAGASEGYDELFARATRLFIPALLRAARVAPGQRVLDVATGTGAAASAAADAVGPSGSVVGGDISSTMLDTARRNLKGRPITLKLLDGQALPYASASFDAVICQLGLMFFPDPMRGLSEFRRVLRPGGWTAASVTTTPDRSLFARIGAVIARHVPETAKSLNRFFSIPDAARLHSLLLEAGLRDVEVRTETRTIAFQTLSAYFRGTEIGAGLVGQEYVGLPPDIQRRVRAEVRLSLGLDRDDQPVEIEMDVLIGSGRS